MIPIPTLAVAYSTKLPHAILRSFRVEENGTYRIQVRDLFNISQADPRLVYRLSIRKETPDFRLVAVAQPPPSPNKDAKEALLWTPCCAAVKPYRSR